MPDPEDRTFSALLDCHYLLRRPEAFDAGTPLVVALHGFGANPEIMLQLTGRLFERPAVIASVQGPNQFFLGADTREVGYGWTTNRRPSESIRLHHEMVMHVAETVGVEFAIPLERRLLVGFSQSVGLNYRLVATHPNVFRGVVAVCGGLPGDWQEGAYQPVTAAILHIARRSDTYYPPNVTEHYSERLRRRASDVEFHLIDGGHQMPSNSHQLVESWLRRVLTRA